MRRGFAQLAVTVLVVLVCAVDAALAADGSARFTQPEEVVKEFVRRIGNEDFLGAIELFNCDMKAEKYDFATYVTRIRSIHCIMLLPSSSKGYVALNREKLRGDATMEIRMFTASILLPDKFRAYIDKMPYVFPKGASDAVVAEEIREFTEALDPQRLQGLRFLSMTFSTPSKHFSEKNQQSTKKNNLTYGCDERKEYIVLYELAGKIFKGGVMLTRYGETWFIDSLSSYLADTPFGGAVVKVE